MLAGLALRGPEVKEAVSQICVALRKALPDATFGECEVEALAISNEAVRELLQGSATARFLRHRQMPT